jgi:hypothetical protein
MPVPSAARLLLIASGGISLTQLVPPHVRSGTARVGEVAEAPPMHAARAAHTATTLADGRVLIAGGFSGRENAAASAELYEPRSASYTPLPAMITPRHSHTATVLPSGKVLLVGGYEAGNATASSAELFDPVTNRFEATGSLRTARADHVAMLLPDGKVLVAGGLGSGWTFLSSAEVYDPATGQFAPTGSMTTARESHAAVRLPDGRVLITGGHRGRHADITLYSSTEIYDPVRGVFRRSGDMRIRRHKHDAVLLRDGRVLIAGGTDERDFNGVYSSTEFFDPHTETFTTGPTMQRPRYKHEGASLVQPSGVVLLAGGASQAETYDPASNTFTLVPGAPRMAGQFSAVAPLRTGGALITGGYGNGTGPRASSWLYRP